MGPFWLLGRLLLGFRSRIGIGPGGVLGRLRSLSALCLDVASCSRPCRYATPGESHALRALRPERIDHRPACRRLRLLVRLAQRLLSHTSRVEQLDSEERLPRFAPLLLFLGSLVLSGGHRL